MKVQGQIFRLETLDRITNLYDFVLQCGQVRINTVNVYKSPSSARRAANRVAKKLNLEVKWGKEGEGNG